MGTTWIHVGCSLDPAWTQRGKPRFNLDPAWIQLGFNWIQNVSILDLARAWAQLGSDLDPAWIWAGSSLDQIWIQLGSSLDPSCIQPGSNSDPRWTKPGSSLDPAWITIGSSFDPDWIQPGSAACYAPMSEISIWRASAPYSYMLVRQLYCMYFYIHT